MSEPPLDDPALQRSLGRWLASGAVLLVLLVAAFPLYRVVESSRRAEAAVERQDALFALGRQLWVANCATCHGPAGEGINAPALNAREFFEQASEPQIHHITQAGVPGTQMPAWWNEFGGPLTDEQIRGIVAFLLSWSETAPSRPDWNAPRPPASPSPALSP